MGTNIEFTPGYTAVKNRLAYYRQPDAGYIRLSGPDRFDFLQRQTTNNVTRLAESSVVRTVLTSATARILDVFTLISKPDINAIDIIPLAGHGTAAAEYLRGKIFFMDQVEVVELSSGFVQVHLEGAKLDLAADLLAPDIKLEMDMVSTVTWNGEEITLIGHHGLNGLGCRVIIPVAEVDGLISALVNVDVVPLTADSYHVLRVEAGLPAVAHELTEEFTPLEVGLSDLVSETKGCYTGQEILARQVTYDKVARQLVGLHVSGKISAGASLRAEGRPAGVVTSVAHSPQYGQIALAVVKRSHHVVGSRLSLDSETELIRGEVVKLPFS